MATGPKYVVDFRRKREGKTNYKKRLALLKSNLPRLVVRISNRYVMCQLIDYRPEGDYILSTSTSKELSKFGWTAAASNLPSAYLTGYLCGKRVLKRGTKKAILDIGFREVVRGSKIFAALKGLVDAGLQIPHNPDVFPSEDRLFGSHIDESLKSKVVEIKTKIDKSA